MGQAKINRINGVRNGSGSGNLSGYKNKPWKFVFLDDHNFDVTFPTRDTLRVRSPRSASDESQRLLWEWFSTHSKVQYPQEGDGVILRNPLEAAFHDVFIRMTTENFNAWNEMDIYHQQVMSHTLKCNLNLINSISMGWSLDGSAPISNGTISVAQALQHIDKFPLVGQSMHNNGYFIDRWDSLIDQAGVGRLFKKSSQA